MARRGQYSDESDSDWDSLSQAIPEQTTTPAAAVVPDEVIENRLKTLQQQNEVARPGSDSNRSIITTRGPLTFFDRKMSNGSPAMKSSTPSEQSSSPVVTAKKEEPPIQPEDLPPNDNVDVKDVAPKIRSPFHDAIIKSSSSSDGFDNVAFEASYSYSPPPPPAVRPAPEDQGKISNLSLPLPDETIEIFPYDKTNIEFNQVSEKKRRAAADRLSESAFEASSRLCSEVTAVIGLPFVIVLAIFLQLLRFVMAGLLRPLLIGLVMAISDGLVKPLLAALHNGVIAPSAAFVHNLTSAVKTALSPLGDIVVTLLTGPISRLMQSCRLVEIQQHRHYRPAMVRHHDDV